MSLFRNFLPFILWFGIILYLSFAPLSGWPKMNTFERLYGDKVIHIGMYAGLSFLFVAGNFLFRKKQSMSNNNLLIGAILCSVIGITVEILQPLLTMYRAFEWLDMVANVVGAFVGAWCFMRLLKKKFFQALLTGLANATG